MTPAELSSLLTAHGWTQVGTHLQNAGAMMKAKVYKRDGHNPLVVVEAGGQARVFRELLHSSEHVIQGKVFGRPV